MSLRAAIDAMCKSCIYDKTQPGTWRAQVGACTLTKCPLHAVRPVPGPTDTAKGRSVQKSANLAPKTDSEAI